MVFIIDSKTLPLPSLCMYLKTVKGISTISGSVEAIEKLATKRVRHTGYTRITTNDKRIFSQIDH
jgi:hypothetical protein